MVLPLVLAETCLRLLPGIGPPRLPLAYDPTTIQRFGAGDNWVMFDRELGWTATPNFDFKRSERYHHNSQGIRAEREYSPLPASGVRRIAAYGDSITYCADRNIEECWTWLLERQLANSEVINFGVPGYAPDQELLRYRRDGATWHPCAVLIAPFTENILRVVNRFRLFLTQVSDPYPKPRFVLQNGRLVLLPNPVQDPKELEEPAWAEANLGPDDAWYFPGMFVANPFDRLEFVRLVRSAAYRRSRQRINDWEQMFQPGLEAFDVLVAELTEFANQVRIDGATPVVVLLPSQAEVAAQAANGSKPTDSLIQALRERGLTVVDTTEALGTAARRGSPSDVIAGHYRILGNEIVARSLATQLPALIAPTCPSGP